MADDFTTDPGAGGSTFGADEIATILYPRIKLIHGADGVNAGDVATGNPLPVVQTGALPTGTNNIGDVDVLSSALPTGAATSALQLPDGHNVTVDNAGGGAAVNIQDGGNSITVDGSVSITGAVDTELPAAAAMSDTMANPTAPAVACHGMVWNGATWDRALGNSTSGASVRVTNGQDSHDAPIGSALPLTIGGRASTATPTAVDADGDACRIWVSRTGAVQVGDGGGSITVDGTVAVSGAVDTELPAAVALADNTANPTVPGVGAFLMCWDSGASNWDRVTTAGLGALNVSIVDTTVTVGDGGGSLTVDNPTLSVVGGGVEAAALRVTIANDSTGLVSVDDNGASLTVDNAALSTTGNGTAAGALRVTMASDSTGQVTVAALPNEGQQTMANSISVAIASDQSLIEVAGDVAHDIAMAGNPVAIALRANTSEPASAVADGDSTYAWGDRHGRQIVALDHPPKPAAAGTHGPYSENSVASGDVELIAAPGASTSIVVTGFWISNQASAKNRIALREGAAGTIRYRGTIAADGGGIEKHGIQWMLPVNTALTINIGTAGDVDASIDFYTQITT